MIRQRAISFLRRGELVVPGLVFLLSWEACARGVGNGVFLFGSPSSIFRAAVVDFSSRLIFRDIGLTSMETVLGLIFGSAIGTVCGFLLWLNRRVGRVCEPYVSILGAVPVVAMAPVIIQLFGTGLLAKIVLAAFATSMISLSHAYEGAQTAQREWLDFSQALGASRWTVVRKIVLPSAFTSVLVGAKLNVGFALIGAFIGEYISSEAGLGRYILRFGGIYDMPRVFLGVGLLATIGLILSAGVSFASRSWTPGSSINTSPADPE